MVGKGYQEPTFKECNIALKMSSLSDFCNVESFELSANKARINVYPSRYGLGIQNERYPHIQESLEQDMTQNDKFQSYDSLMCPIFLQK